MEKLLDNNQLEEALNASTAPRITSELMENRIASVDYFKIKDTLTICSIRLDNGYNVIGISACVDKENYREAVGKKIAYDDAFKKLWPLFGFLLAEHQAFKKPINSSIEVGDLVKKITGDYSFKGTVVSVFPKVNGMVRLVVEDDRGILHIYSEKNLAIVSKAL